MNKSNLTKKSTNISLPSQDCCPPDIFLANGELQGNNLILTLNNGQEISVDLSALAVIGATVAGFARHPDALTNPTLYHTIRITLSDASTFDLNLLPLLGNIANTIFVSKNGNDTLAQAAGNYNPHQPFANPTIAMANAAVGDTVVVYAGEYTIGNVGGEDLADDGLQRIVKDGVVLYMFAGAKIIYTNQTAAHAPTSIPFTDGGSPASLIIRGEGKFQFNENIDAGNTWNATGNPNTILDWEFDEIDVRKTWGDIGHDAAIFRMVGKKYINRESMLFALRYPFAATDRKVYIKFEETLITAENVNTTWSRVEIRNFSDYSNAYIDLGKTSYPNTVSGGAFFVKNTCSALSEINFYAKSLYRYNDDSIRDYLVLGLADFSKGDIKIDNINTSTALALNIGVGGSISSKRKESFSGVIRNGYIGGLDLTLYGTIGTDNPISCNLDIVVDAQSALFKGITLTDSPKTSVSGKIAWRNTTNSPVLITVGNTNYGKLENLILSEIDAAVPSVTNEDVVPQDIKIMNVFATTAVGPLVNQLIETIKVDSNV